MSKLILGKLAIIAIVGVAQTSVAQSVSDEISFSAGVRFWDYQWRANGLVTPIGSGSGVYTHKNSGSKYVPTIVGSFRYKDISLSASHLQNTPFDVNDGYLKETYERNESDINLSYYFLPGLSAGLGYKELRFQDGQKISGPIASLSAAAPLGSNLGLYGSAAFGALRANYPAAVTLESGVDVGYFLAELGFSYLFNTPNAVVKGLSATLGYRFQTFEVKNLHWANNGGASYTDITSGPTAGISVHF